MVNPMSDKPGDSLRKSDPEKYARLRAEAAAPYRGLRKFIYGTFAASGAIGGFVFLTQMIARQDVSEALPNFALQIGVVSLMIWLLRLENRSDRKP
jgi:hypothetical protein